jgi:hypothetical protein
METTFAIVRDQCDCCNTRRITGVTFYDNHREHAFICRDCNPDLYNSTAEQQKEDFLAGRRIR